MDCSFFVNQQKDMIASKLQPLWIKLKVLRKPRDSYWINTGSMINLVTDDHSVFQGAVSPHMPSGDPNLPVGPYLCAVNGHHCVWYLTVGSVSIYLPTDDCVFSCSSLLSISLGWGVFSGFCHFQVCLKCCVWRTPLSFAFSQTISLSSFAEF